MLKEEHVVYCAVVKEFTQGHPSYLSTHSVYIPAGSHFPYFWPFEALTHAYQSFFLRWKNVLYWQVHITNEPKRIINERCDELFLSSVLSELTQDKAQKLTELHTQLDNHPATQRICSSSDLTQFGLLLHGAHNKIFGDSWCAHTIQSKFFSEQKGSKKLQCGSFMTTNNVFKKLHLFFPTGSHWSLRKTE